MPTTRGATIEYEVMIRGGVTVMAGITIGPGSFIAAGAVVTCDIPPRSFVRGCPGRIEPLPEKLDVETDKSLSIQTRDLWPLQTPGLETFEWPDDWAESWYRNTPADGGWAAD